MPKVEDYLYEDTSLDMLEALDREQRVNDTFNYLMYENTLLDDNL